MIGYMTEEVALIEDLTAEDHLRLAEGLSPTWSAKMAAHLTEALDLARSKPAKHLSRGNRVKLGLVLALSRAPKVVVLDEPTSGLDPVAREVVINEIRRLRESQVATLISSHILDDVRELADAIAVIKAGRIVGMRSNTVELDRLRTDVLRLLKKEGERQ
jgi:ABC-2 type transport system ATP-binding protein